MKVFISSVMKDFGDYRQSAKRAAELLRHQAVMAEDFGARPDDPQSACLSEVRDSDVYMVILGERYGWIGPSGVSPTEQEYDEAVRVGKPILAFVSEGDKEDKQQQFAAKVQDYTSGVFRASFSTPESLKDEVVRALRSWEQRGESRRRTAEEARAEFDAALSFVTTNSRETLAILSCVPTHTDIALSATAIGKAELRKDLAKELLFGDFAYFDSELGRKEDIDENRIVIFQQSDQSGLTAVLIVSRTGQLTMGHVMPRSQGSRFDFTDAMVVDQEAVRAMLLRFAGFASRVYPSGLNYKGQLYASASLVNMEMKLFGHRPKRDQCIGMFMGENQTVVSVPALPEQFSLPTDSKNRSAVADTLIDLFIRRFRKEHRLSSTE